MANSRAGCSCHATDLVLGVHHSGGIRFPNIESPPQGWAFSDSRSTRDYASKYCMNSNAVGRRRDGLSSFSSFHSIQVSTTSLPNTSPLSKKA